MKTNPARRWESQIETETRKLQETKTVSLLTSQTEKVVGLRLGCTDREFSRQCGEDAMYANKHNQTSVSGGWSDDENDDDGGTMKYGGDAR